MTEPVSFFTHLKVAQVEIVFLGKKEAHSRYIFGIVDYGETHSRVHGHNLYGRTIPQGSYTEWSTKYPLNFLGHSMVSTSNGCDIQFSKTSANELVKGGPTIIKLQWLLSIGFFGGDYDPDMILSVTTGPCSFP